MTTEEDGITYFFPSKPVGTRFGELPPLPNYWHYLIGYLAPLCALLLVKLRTHPPGSSITVVLQNSTETLNEVSRTILRPLGVLVRFADLSSQNASFLGSILHRADKWTRRVTPWRGKISRVLRIPIGIYLQRIIFTLSTNKITKLGATRIDVTSTDYQDWWWDNNLSPDKDYLQNIQAIQHVARLARLQPCNAHYNGQVIILRRTSQSRLQRVMKDDDGLASHLRQAGIPSIVYAPGKHSLTCQISVFKHARGVIGARGAEFTNLVWCERVIPVVIVQNPSIFPDVAPQAKLCELMSCPLLVIFKTDLSFRTDVPRVADWLKGRVASGPVEGL